MKLGFYTSKSSDLLVQVTHVYFKKGNELMLRLNLFNKKNGIVYEYNSNYKVKLTSIKDWKYKGEEYQGLY